MNIEQLRYAHAVAQWGSFSAAARQLGLTQPALSNGIARLEEELGLPLFERSTRGVRPTGNGARILPMVEDVLNGLAALTSQARALASPPSATLCLGVSPLIGGDLIAATFDAARGMARPRDLVLRETDLALLGEDLRAGRLDLLLIPAVIPMPGFEQRVIAREPVLVINPDDEEEGVPVDVGDIGGAEYILVPDTCGLTTFTRELFQSRDLPLRAYRGEASSYRVVDEWAGLGIGAAILPKSKITHHHACSRPLMRDGRPVEIRYEAVWDASSASAPEIEEFVGLLSVTGPDPS